MPKQVTKQDCGNCGTSRFFCLFHAGGNISLVNSDGDSCLYLATYASGNDANCALLKLLIEKGKTDI